MDSLLSVIKVVYYITLFVDYYYVCFMDHCYYGLLFSFLFRVSTMILWYTEVSLLSTEYRPVWRTFGTLKVGLADGRFFHEGGAVFTM